MAPDIFPVGESAFAWSEHLADADHARAYAWLAAALTLAILSGLIGWWWFDRVAEPPALRPTIHQGAWSPPAGPRERVFARLEATEDRP